MNREFIKQFEMNKGFLEKYFRENNRQHSYESILKKILEICIPNPRGDGRKWDLDKMTVIDDGDWQGTQIFIIPIATYQPTVCEYAFTDNYYGSCSGCDALQMIDSLGLPNEKLNEKQVQGYMKLALHLVQKLEWLKTV